MPYEKRGINKTNSHDKGASIDNLLISILETALEMLEMLDILDMLAMLAMLKIMTEAWVLIVMNHRTARSRVGTCSVWGYRQDNEVDTEQCVEKEE